ncbi:MAG: alpha amylase C-terminal domain-containing protein [Thermodesulfobacteriota bacterium]|nr:alpha amylase C-terminal domain-containing protein [Thermodesulfobacteriota bacterium]
MIAEHRLTNNGARELSDAARNHEYFGLHRTDDGWVFREWAPNAEQMFLIGDMTGWQHDNAFALEPIGNNGVWEISLPENALRHGDLYRLHLQWPGGGGDRIPAYARRVVQDPHTLIFNAQVWDQEPYDWRCNKWPVPDTPLLIYEAHVGMAQEKSGVGTYREFTDHIIPRIAASGYNALQLMAVQEHPYYGSFGYHVSSFFAASSRFGTPEELKALIDAAHSAGLIVIMDIVHSHAVNNEVEGISRFDGTRYQYFHDGHRGSHHAWDSRCFDYSKDEVLHFLLSNCRYWLEEFRFDGFRFDGITSMLYLDHGLEKAFTTYDDYFCDNVDEDALVYLNLANALIHEVKPPAITIAEDISGMPGLAMPVPEGGNGFDCRLAMGVPDFWIKLVKEYRDEDWPMGALWYELTNRRPDEKTISYAESHDQALVGDKTLIFRMIDADMYDHMHLHDNNLRVDRGIALYNLIRLITMATAGHGYQTFMGNEFGHPEWIDFPRQGNNWSYHYARRQWSLADHPDLKYRLIQQFDRDMVSLAKQYAIFRTPWPYRLYEHSDDKVLAFKRGPLVFIFNFHPTVSHADYEIPAPPGEYALVMNSDDPGYHGHGRIVPDQTWFTMPDPHNRDFARLKVYLPTRTALILHQRGE